MKCLAGGCRKKIPTHLMTTCFALVGLNIDDATAAYYLQSTRGDMKAAFLLYKEDLAWETEHPVGILPLRERVPIPEMP